MLSYINLHKKSDFFIWVARALVFDAQVHPAGNYFSHIFPRDDVLTSDGSVCVGLKCCFQELDRVKMSNTEGESRDRNICRIGCGRPGQRDYGWKGPAFNCCFGTVACLVEHKRPVRRASVARTCEYLPDQWNAPLFPPQLAYKPKSWPSYSLRSQALLALVWLTFGGGDRKTHVHVCTPNTWSMSGAV